MSARPEGSGQEVPGQDATYARIDDLVAAVITALHQEQPGLHDFVDHRPSRDRSSGNFWQGIPTACHLSALRAATGVPDLSGDARGDLLAAADRVAVQRGMRRRSESSAQGISMMTWVDDRGDLLEVIVGVRVAVRAISSAFLPDPAVAPRDR